MVNDQEPRYRLVDSNGNVVGSLFQNAAGNVEIQDETGTGSVFGPDGIVTPAIDAGSVSTDELTADNAVITKQNASEITLHTGDAVTVEDSPETIFEFADPVNVINGHIVGGILSTITVTWADGTTNDIIDTVTRGRTRGGSTAEDELTVASIPSIIGVTKMEFADQVTDPEDYGFVARTI